MSESDTHTHTHMALNTFIMNVLTKRTQWITMQGMKDFEWNEEKNNWLKEHRDISFETIAFYIENGGLLDSYEHPNKERYPRQSIFVVRTDCYVYIVPFIEEDKYYFLKTIIPNSKAKKRYVEADNG